MKIACVILSILAAIFVVSCSGSSEAKTRKDKVGGFTEAFGFPPPSTITTINFTDLSHRGVMDGDYGQWISFTFDQASFDKIILSGYKEEKNDDIDCGAAPPWWPKTIPKGTAIFSRSQDDTSENEGFQFQAYIWHDSSLGLVFFHKSYWD